MTPDKVFAYCAKCAVGTLAETGKKIGVSLHRVSDYETGQRAISKDIAKKLAGVFNTTPARFI